MGSVSEAVPAEEYSSGREAPSDSTQCSTLPITRIENYSWCETIKRTRVQEQTIEPGKYY